MPKYPKPMSPATKPCPICGEVILVRARKCKHCGEWMAQHTVRVQTLDPYVAMREAFWDRYKIDDEIGRGGMGIVFRAEQRNPNRWVALKVLPPHLLLNHERDEFLKRFAREAKAAGGLTSHPNIVTIYESGEHGGFHYIAMEYVAGPTLQSLIRDEGPLSIERWVRLFAPLADALDHAHQSGIIHRDIKSANIIITDQDRPVLLDFGIARPRHGATTLTQQGHMLGTPDYMSPEQARGEPVSPQSDLYSLGVVMYEALCGVTPFHGSGNTMSILYRIVHQPFTPVRSLRPDAPFWVITLIHKLLSKDLPNRFERGTDIATALQQGLADMPAEAARAVPTIRPAAAPDLDEATRRETVPPVVPPAAAPVAAKASDPPAKPETVKPETAKPKPVKPPRLGLKVKSQQWLVQKKEARLQRKATRHADQARRKAARKQTYAQRKAARQAAFRAAWLKRRNLVRGFAGLLVLGMVSLPFWSPQPDLTPDPWVGIERVSVGGGSFRMGDLLGDGDADEQPVRRVTLKPFAMSAHEITFAQYDAYAELTGRPKPADGGMGRGRMPVSNITWFEAVRFCEWLSKRTGKTVRLPTEAEWEYAARNGGEVVRYPWGNVFEGYQLNYDDRGRYFNQNGRQTDDGYATKAPVGTYPPNDLGLYDMAGNVDEWCLDQYDLGNPGYQATPADNPTGPRTGDRRVIRGGAYISKPHRVRTTARNYARPEAAGHAQGFRIVVETP